MKITIGILLMAGGLAAGGVAGAVTNEVVAAPVAVLAESLSLEQAYDRSLETDQTIRIAYEEIRKANLQPWSALTRLGPSVTGNGAFFQPQHDISSSGSAVIIDNKSANITVQQPLIDLTVFPAYRFGRLSAESARLAHRFTVRNVLFGVTQAYYNVLKAQRLVAIDHQTLALAGQQLDLAQNRYQVGEVTKTDVLRARVTVEQSRRTVIESENTLRLAQNILSNILNFGIERSFTVSEPPAYPDDVEPLGEAERRATEQREDYRVSQLAVEQSMANHRQVMAQYAPRVVAQWNNQWNEPATPAAPNNFWEATLAVQMPFFEGGQRELDWQRTRYEITQAQLSRESLAKSIEVEVKTAWLSAHTLAQTLAALRAQVAAAEENYKDLQNQYRAGTATSLDVLTALDDLNRAHTDLVSETYDYQVALRNLERSAGVFQAQRVEKMRKP